MQRAAGLLDASFLAEVSSFVTFFVQSDINTLHDPAALSDPICLSALDTVMHVRPCTRGTSNNALVLQITHTFTAVSNRRSGMSQFCRCPSSSVASS